MANKVSYNSIPDKNTDWGKDPTNNLPFSGQSVQEFIKKQLNSKSGCYYYDASKRQFLVFADKESKNIYLNTSNASLIIGVLDISNIVDTINKLHNTVNSFESTLNTTVNNVQNNTNVIDGEVLRLETKIIEECNVLKDQIEEIQNEINVLEENINASLETLQSNLNTFVNNEVKKLLTEINLIEENNNNNITALQNRLTTLGRDITLQTDNKIATVNSNITELESALNNQIDFIQDSIIETNSDISNLNTEFDTLQASVSNTQTVVDNNLQRIITLEDDVKNLKQTNIESIIENIELLETSINNINTDILSIKQTNQDQEVSISTIENSVTDIQTSIDDLEEEIEGLKSKTGSLEDIINSDVSAELIDELTGEVTQLKTSITQSAEEISLLASRISETETNLSRIDINANNISLLTSRVNEAENSLSRIDVNADSIELLSSRVTANETSIGEFSVTADEIKGSLNQLTTKVNGVTGDIESIKEVQASHTMSINNHGVLISQKADVTIIDELNNKITTNSSRIDQTESSINLLTEKVEGIPTEEGLIELREQVASIESTIDGLGPEIEAIASDVTTLGNNYTDLEARLTITENDISTKVTKEEYDADLSELNNQYSEVVQDVNGINTTILDMDGEITSIRQSIDGITVSVGDIEADVESLKKQNDGSISSYFAEGEPTSENYPANEWYNAETGIDERNNHVGDLYYDTVSGFAYRYLYDNSTSTYYWLKITDTDITEALELAAQALAAVDGKSTTFVKDLTIYFDDYKEGDIWILPSNIGEYVKGTLLVCVKDNKGFFSWDDWEDQLKYVDSSALNDLKSEINEAIEDGVLTAEERSSVQAALTSFESMFADLTAERNHLALTFASSTSIENLNTCYTKLETYYTSLIDSIEEILNAETITDDLKSAYETALSNYNGYFETYREAVEAVKESINQTLNGANIYLENVIADGVVTPIEKLQLRETKRQLVNEFTNNKTAAVNYDIIDSNGVINTNGHLTTDSGDTYFIVYGNYGTAYNNLIGFFQNNLKVDESSTTTTIEAGYVEELNNLFESYNETLISFVEIIEILQKKYNDSISEVEELANSLSSELTIDESITKIGKGVVLSSIIGVQKNGVLKAGLIASDNADRDEDGNKILIASGIPEGEDADWNDSTFVVYDNGNVKLNSVNLGDFQIDEHKRLISRIDDGLGVYDIILSSHGINGARYHTDGTPLFYYNIGKDSAFYADYSPDEDPVERTALTLEGKNTALALDIPLGNVRGLRPIVRKITTDDELTWKDHTLIVDNSSAITLTLNDSVENGQCYKLLHITDKQVSVSSTTNNIFCVNFSSGSTSSYNNKIYLTEKGVWYLTYFDGYWYMEKYSYNAE